MAPFGGSSARFGRLVKCLAFGFIEIICPVCHNAEVSWLVEVGDEFEPEFFALPEGVQVEILALTRLLQQFGPQLGRPALTH